MKYISYEFIAFLVLAILIYYIAPKKIRPHTILLFNLGFCFFGGFPTLIYLTVFTVITFFAGFFVTPEKKHRRAVRNIYIIGAVLSIFIFKFTGYIIGGVSNLFGVSLLTPQIIAPLGLSFFTLQGISYILDIGRGACEPEHSFFYFAEYLTFFPTIVQGPIARYRDIGAQFKEAHKLEYKNLKYGAQLVLFGFFEKLVIANRAAIFADEIFNGYEKYSGLTVVLGAFVYAIQLYTDFAGCVNICRGAAQMLGFNLTENFNHPYFAVSIKDFWARWHISLSSFLRDYVYIPLGGNRKGKVRKYLNNIITFAVSGLWHGVGIHYLVWGIYHSVMQIAGELLIPLRKKFKSVFHINENCFSYRLWQSSFTFVVVSVGWLIFRANGLRAALSMFASIFTGPQSFAQIKEVFFTGNDIVVLIISVIVLFVISFAQTKRNLRDSLEKQNLWFRWGVCLVAIFVVIILGVYGRGYNASDFLYMQY